MRVRFTHDWQFILDYSRCPYMMDVWTFQIGLIKIHTMPEPGTFLIGREHFKGFWLTLDIGWRSRALLSLTYQQLLTWRNIPLIPWLSLKVI